MKQFGSQNVNKIKRKQKQKLYEASLAKKSREYFEALDKSELVNICLHDQDMIESYKRSDSQAEKLLRLSELIINKLKMKLKLKFRESWQN